MLKKLLFTLAITCTMQTVPALITDLAILQKGTHYTLILGSFTCEDVADQEHEQTTLITQLQAKNTYTITYVAHETLQATLKQLRAQKYTLVFATKQSFAKLKKEAAALELEGSKISWNSDSIPWLKIPSIARLACKDLIARIKAENARDNLNTTRILKILITEQLTRETVRTLTAIDVKSMFVSQEIMDEILGIKEQLKNKFYKNFSPAALFRTLRARL